MASQNELLYDLLVESLKAAKTEGHVFMKALPHVQHGISGKIYYGLNDTRLAESLELNGYTAPVWGTFNQWKEVGAMVKKGQVSTLINPAWKYKHNEKDILLRYEEYMKLTREEKKEYHAVAPAHDFPIPMFNLDQVDIEAEAESNIRNLFAEGDEESRGADYGIVDTFLGKNGEVLIGPDEDAFRIDLNADESGVDFDEMVVRVMAVEEQDSHNAFLEDALRQMCYATVVQNGRVLFESRKDPFLDSLSPLERTALNRIAAEMSACRLMSKMGADATFGKDSCEYIDKWLEVSSLDKSRAYNVLTYLCGSANNLIGRQIGLAKPEAKEESKAITNELNRLREAQAKKFGVDEEGLIRKRKSRRI